MYTRAGAKKAGDDGIKKEESRWYDSEITCKMGRYEIEHKSKYFGNTEKMIYGTEGDVFD